MVDDGVKSRKHRNNIFNPEYKVVGIGTHKHFGSTVVIDYAD